MTVSVPKPKESEMYRVINAYLSTEKRNRCQQVPRLFCADGFNMSVQASDTHYCSPRDAIGPWQSVEVGLPSEPVAELMPYADDAEHPTGTVYGYVPVEVIDAIIAAHGGLKGE